MSITDEQKKALRTELKRKRAALQRDVWQKKSQLILHHFFHDTRLAAYQKVHCYVSMNHRYEVDTHPIITQLLAQQKEVIVPITEFSNGQLIHTKLKSFEDLSENEWGVLEPNTVSQVPPDYASLILVPLLGVDEQGNRLGYGKGFYDRFLIQTKALKLGLVFEEFVLEKIPTNAFDQPLDGFITENGVRYLKQ